MVDGHKRRSRPSAQVQIEFAAICTAQGRLGMSRTEVIAWVNASVPPLCAASLLIRIYGPYMEPNKGAA
jgi:hypothetical protein